jgi:CRISPR-associated protein Cst2
VKFEPDRRKTSGQAPKGEGTIAGSQTVFHRPANSGVYALICHLELARIGVNDITHEIVLQARSRRRRQQAAVQALLATLVQPAGAQRNTQNPHVLGCSGVLSTSTSYLPAPLLSPMAEDYRLQIAAIADTLNRITPKAIGTREFATLAEAVALIEQIAKDGHVSGS